MTITYSKASNARRAARKALGKTAREPNDFMITVQAGGQYTWEAVAQQSCGTPAPRVKEAAASKTKETAASKANEPSTKKNGVRPGSKLAIIADLLRRPEGCTTADVLKATGWPAVSMPASAKAAGLALKKEKVDGVTVYRAG